jgi:hypothetical protein
MGKRWESLWIGLQNVTLKLQEKGSSIVGDVERQVLLLAFVVEKRRKENFRNSVPQCLDRGKVLTRERQRMFSK